MGKSFYLFLLCVFCFCFIGCPSTVDHQILKNSDVYTDDSFTEELFFPFKAEYSELPIKNYAKWGSWSREEGCISLKYDENQKIEELNHTGKEDYSVSISDSISVNNGETYLIATNVFLSQGDFRANFILYDEKNEVLNWSGGETTVLPENGYQVCFATITVDEKIKKITPRFVGSGKTVAKIKNTSIYQLKINREENLSIENSILKITCNTNTACVNVFDKRNGRLYKQSSDSIKGVIYTDCFIENNIIVYNSYDAKGKTALKLKVGFSSNDAATVEYLVEMAPESNFSSLNFPQKSISSEGDYLVMPINEGMCIDYDDTDFYPYELVTYSGHGLCMPFFGITNKDTGAGFISIIKDPDDCAVKMIREETNCVGAIWKGQKGKFGYNRHLSQSFLENGGHVAIAKKYREYAKANGLLVTFDEKKSMRGEKGQKNLEKLMGAANIWCWYYEWNGHEAPALVEKIKDYGIDRILWSNSQSAKSIDKINQMGVLTGRYDIYQDVMDPANYNLVSYIHEDWLPEAFPNDISIDKDGKLVHAWPVEKKDGNGYIDCVALCDMAAAKYARKKISEELNEKNYGARFFDTTTASSLRECYSSSHPMTRTQSRMARYELLSIASNENQLVTGSETGMDFVVPVCDYFEGMMSLGPYRRENAGRNVDKTWDEIPPQILNFQLNEKKRLPLWELVYHDCCVAYWYWGDHNNTFNDQKIWDKRDDFNALYGVPPMYWVQDEEHWEKNKNRFLQSYKRSAEITRKTAGYEMVSHEFLTEDRSVQKTRFSNGVEVIVDFNSDTISSQMK